MEEATRAVYHRTPEEMEVIKENNRQAAAELVLKLSGKESLTIEDIEQLPVGLIIEVLCPGGVKNKK